MANSVMRTINSERIHVTTLDQMKDRIVRHFLKLFDCDDKVTPYFTTTFEVQVLPKLNAWMCSYPREEEIKSSLFSMPCGKALGPDGIHSNIFDSIGEW